jgi:hypothetical protein
VGAGAAGTVGVDVGGETRTCFVRAGFAGGGGVALTSVAVVAGGGEDCRADVTTG